MRFVKAAINARVLVRNMEAYQSLHKNWARWCVPAAPRSRYSEAGTASHRYEHSGDHRAQTQLDRDGAVIERAGIFVNQARAADEASDSYLCLPKT